MNEPIPFFSRFIFHTTFLAPFGYDIHFTEGINARDSTVLATRVRLITNICGYIPVIATIVALTKLFFIAYRLLTDATDDRAVYNDFYMVFTVRTIVELTSCGVLILPILDIIVTIFRLWTIPPGHNQWYSYTNNADPE